MRGFLIVAAVVGLPQAATADPLAGLHLEGYYLKVGAESGVAFGRERGASPLVGGIVTFVHINDDREWIGFQGDLLADGNGELATGARWSIGPEAGVSVYGVDVGYFGARVDGETHHGMQIRAKLTVGLAAVYARVSYSLVNADEAGVDVGIQLKAPVWMKRPKRGAAMVAGR